MTKRDNPFRLVGGTDASTTGSANRGGRRQDKEHDPRPPAPAENNDLSPDEWDFPGELAAKVFRDRATVARDIKGHIIARRAYQQGVAWLVAAEDQNLPLASIEAAREDVRTFHSEMVEAARKLVIVMPTDLKALCDLTMYLETNFTSLPEEVVRSTGNRSAAPRVESLAFHLLRTMRLSLRHVAKYGKHGKDCDRLSRRGQPLDD